MKKYQIYESPDCLIYDNSETPQIYLHNLANNSTRRAKLATHVIGFMMEGAIRITFPDKSEYLFRKGQMMFMPCGSIYLWNILEKTQMLMYRLQNPGFRLCERFPVESLYREDAQYLGLKQKPDGNPEPDERFSLLEIHPRLWQRAESVRDCIVDGIRCKKYFEMEIETFFILIRCYYEKKDLYSFLRFILTGNMVFTEFIRLRWKDYHTVGELAGAMHLTPKYFTRKFRQFFGQNPHHWMAINRARVIFDELTSSDKPFKQIATDSGFKSFQQFAAFTKKVIGKTPTEVRDGNGSYPSD